MSKSPVQKREALAIVKKLGAKLQPDGKHQLATFELNGITIATFGIRHGSRSGHGHLVGRYGDLKLSESKVLAMAQCTMSKEQYIQHLKDIGDI